MSNLTLLILIGAIAASVLVIVAITRNFRTHPLSRKEENTLEKIAEDD